VPSISSPLPGMPEGKPAGVRCIHLDDEYRCRIFHEESRPAVCDKFKADPLVCGTCREDAIKIMAELEGINYLDLISV
jgi:uncharacterized protein